MRIKTLLVMLLIIIAIVTGCSNNKLADWAYYFVVWDGYLYIVSDEYIEAVDQEIGAVTKYSDRAGTYSGNFSNKYKKGTVYYSIQGISTDEAIAIQEEDGRYKKAIRDGKYGKE